MKVEKNEKELTICENTSLQIKKIENIFSERKKDWEDEIKELYCKQAVIDGDVIKMTNLEYHCYVALKNYLKHEPTIKDFNECNLAYYQCDPKYFSYKDVRLLQFEVKKDFEYNEETRVGSYQIKTSVKILT